MNIHEIIKGMEFDTIVQILEDNGIERLKVGKEYDQFSTMYRGGDSDKLYLYRDSNGLVDYAGGGPISLVDVLSISRGEDVEDGFRESCNVVMRYAGVVRRGVKREIVEVEEEDTYQFELCPCEPYEDVMNFWYDIPCQKWLDEGISEETQKYFKIRWDWSKGSAIIPVRDIEGKLSGIIERNFDPELVERGFKYMPVSYKGKFLNYPLGNSFYGLYENAEAIRKTRCVYLVEGEKSVMKAREFGIYNCLATKGMKCLSRWQIDMLRYLGVMKIVLCLDKDYIKDDGSEGAKRFFEKRRKIYKDTAEKFPLVYCREGCDCEVKEHENVFDHGIDVFERSKECRIVS